MPTDATFESFEMELNRLVESWQRLTELTQPGWAEAQLGNDFLYPEDEIKLVEGGQ
jgi:hypothetical protein